MVAEVEQGRVGERHHASRHSNATVERARVLHDEGLGYRRIAQQLGISHNTIEDWCSYRSRAHG